MALSDAVNRYLASFGRKSDADTLAAYVLVLSDLTPEQQSAALNAAMRQGREFPLAAGSLRALGLTNGLGANALASRAWDVLLRAMERHSYTISVAFDDGAINAVVRRLGGWERVCGMAGDELHTWARKSFIAIYKEILESGCSEELRRPLVGWLERTKSLSNFPQRVAVGVEYKPVVKALPAPSENRKPLLELKKVQSLTQAAEEK